MATASDVLPVTAWMEWAPGADPAADPTTYAWRGLTSNVMPTVQITRGRPDQFTDVPPSQMAARLLNDGRWIRLNPTGPYFGQLRRTSPFRLIARSNTNYALDGFNRAVSSSWGTADGAGGAWTAVGGSASDFSVAAASGGRHSHSSAVRRYTLLAGSVKRTRQKVRFRINQAATGGALTSGLICRYVDSSNFSRADVQAGTSGTLTVRIVDRVGGSDSLLKSAVVPGLTHSTSVWYWLLLEASEGTPRVKVWVDGTIEPDTWLIDGSAVTAEFTDVAGQHGVMSFREAGNTNTTPTFDFDGYELTDGPRARMTGNTAKLPPSWADHSLSQGYADLTVFGPSGRAQKQKALKSALFRANTLNAGTTAAYWSCEDGSGSTRFASGLSAGFPIGGFSNVSLAADSTIAGSDPLPVYGAGSAWATSIPAYVAPFSNWYVRFVMKLPGSPGGVVKLMEWTTDGTIARWAVELTPGTPDVLRLRGYNAAGAELLADAGANFVDSATGAELLGRQLHFQASASWSGSTTNWTLSCFYVGDPSGGTRTLSSGSYGSAATGNVNGCSHNASAGYGSGGYTLGHIYVGLGGGPVNGWGSNGYAGERTIARWSRLCDEQGIPGFVGQWPTAVATSDQMMGAQRTGGVLDLLRETAETEAGVVVDGKLGHLTLLPRVSRQRRPVALTLDVALGQVSWPFQPADDDFGFKNSVVATSPSGFRSVKEDPASIAADGEYQLPLSVNPQSPGDVDQAATWRRWLGTWDEMRFARIELDLRGHPELIDAWLDCDIGSRIRVVNVPTGKGLPPDDLDLLIEGYTETIDSVLWRVALNVVPARPWDTYVLGGAGNAGRLDTRGSTLNAAAAAGNLDAFDFEAGVSGWTPAGGTFVASTAHAYAGTGAGLLTTTGSPAQTIARREVAVTAGVTYAATVRVYSVAGYADVSAAIDWYNAGHVYLSTTNLGGSALAAATWERRSVYGAAPVGAAFAQYGPTAASSPVAGTAVWVDDAAFVLPLSVATSSGPVWRPGVVDFDVEAAAEKVNFFYVNGSSSPQTVGAIRSRNGVSKAQTSGTTVKLWRAGVLGL